MGFESGSVEIIAGTGGIIGQDVWATIDEQLHEHSPELGETLVQMVVEKTPQLTGALKSSITYEAYMDTGDEDLVFVYSDDPEQLMAWARIYVQYQEGGPLGEPTYTNPPRMMFLQTAEVDGLVATFLWAEKYVQEGIDLCLGGAGLPI